jgi:hypothetical protein
MLQKDRALAAGCSDVRASVDWARGDSGHCACPAQSLNRRHQRIESKLTMRAETQNVVDEIKQSLGLLRRHL